MSQAAQPRLHRAWIVAAVTLAALVAAAAFRSSTGVLMEPIEQTFGWSRATTSGAVSLNLILFGLTAPFAAALMERFGIRVVVAVSLFVVGSGSALTTVMTQPWHLWVLWGLCVGIGTGSMALVFGAIVANRWFTARRGLVTGVLSAANATGQLVFLPLIAATASGPGWRWAAGIVATLSFVMVPLVLLLLTDRPSDVGQQPYGAAPQVLGTDVPNPPAMPSGTVKPVQLALVSLRDASKHWSFWALFVTFWICGWSTNGLVQTHFVPAAHDHGMPATTAAGLLAVIGLFDIVGTIASGWLTDRFDSRYLLAGYFGFRGLSLFLVPGLLAATVEPGMWVFIIFYGLDWVATVPPTVALCREHFGLERSGIVFGWLYASHMVGAGVAASVAGWIRTSHGDYQLAWLLAGGLCLAACALALTIPRHRPAPNISQPVPAG